MSPRHDSTADAEAAGTHVCDAGVTPGCEQPLERPLLVVAADRGAEERADFVPAVADQPAGAGEAGAHPELPQRPPDPARQAELETGDRPARLHDARQLAQRCGGILDVAE